MVITPHLQERFAGHVFNYKRYTPVTLSDVFVIFHHGKGEVGPLDATKLDLLEKHGPPKHAKNGFEYPFNIIAIQSVSSHNISRQIAPLFVKMKFNPGVILVTGLSMGGYATFDTITYDTFGLVYAIAPVCGGVSSKDGISGAQLVKTWPEINAWAFHGDKDTTVKYQSSKGPVDAYNATHTKQIKYTLYPGVGHAAWEPAYSVTPGEDELTKQLIKWGNEAPRVGVDAEALKRLNAILHQMQNNADSIDQGIFHIRETFTPQQ